jgi:hypothetical protein
MSGARESTSYPQLVLVFGVLPVAFTSFLPEPFGIVVPAVAWAILSGVSWYIGRTLAALGWLLFLLLTAGFFPGRELIDGMLAVVVFFACLICAFSFVVADTYFNTTHDEHAAT